MNHTIKFLQRAAAAALVVSLTASLAGCSKISFSPSMTLPSRSSNTIRFHVDSTTAVTTTATTTTTAQASESVSTPYSTTTQTTQTPPITQTTFTPPVTTASASVDFAQQVENYDLDSLIPLTSTELATGVSAREATAWFEDSVFIGDSVTMGFRNYIMYQQQHGDTDCMGSPLFLACGSLSARETLKPISADSLHPMYKGEKRLIEDVIAEVGAKRVFIQFGLNEIAVDGLEAPIDYMNQLIERILKQSPDVEIYIISATYMVEGSEKQKLNNPNIRQLNYNRMKYAVSKGYGYVDVANNICDENGYLFSEYSADQYVHQVNVSYKVWEKVFLSYASHQIVGE